MTSDRQDEHWQQSLAALESQWREQGHERLWTLYRFRLKRQIQQLLASSQVDNSFSEEEIASRRGQLSDELHQRFLHRLTNLLFSSRLWRRRKALSEEGSARAFALLGKTADLEQMQQINADKQASLGRAGVRELFSLAQRRQRISAEYRALQRAFRRQQERLLAHVKRYQQKLGELPEDEIDQDIWRLGEDYAFIGRSRQWYDEFEELVSQSLGGDLPEGQNEPALRVLQNDFLLTMQGRMPQYLRYYELRRHVFDLGDRELINAFSYFEQQHRHGNFGEESEQIVMSRFMRGVSHKLQLRSREQQAQSSVRERLLAVDHQARLSEWSAWKEAWLQPSVDPATSFNELRKILAQAPEWRQELSVFRSGLQVKRLMAEAGHSYVEASEVRGFIDAMAERVDHELPTDVLFRSIEQELIREHRELDALRLVREQIAHEIRNRSDAAADNIMALKQAFVDTMITGQAGPNADVRPLFARSSSQGNGGWVRPAAAPGKKTTD